METGEALGATVYQQRNKEGGLLRGGAPGKQWSILLKEDRPGLQGEREGNGCKVGAGRVLWAKERSQ